MDTADTNPTIVPATHATFPEHHVSSRSSPVEAGWLRAFCLFGNPHFSTYIQLRSASKFMESGEQFSQLPTDFVAIFLGSHAYNPHH